MSDPLTPTDQDDPVPAEEEPTPEAPIETGAWMGERDTEPSESPDPVEP